MPSHLHPQTLLTRQPPTTQDSSLRTDPQPNNPSDAIHILYTGRLLGYFRVPDWQRPDDPMGCSKTVMQDGSSAAQDFDRQLKRAKVPGAILVGTGDNFGPELEARVFSPPPDDPERKQGQYAPSNKELYDWDKDHGTWVSHKSELQNPTLQNRLSSGNGTIPTDNVGCFLVQEGYAAVVPGKHDFYFGPERLRELARFLATTPVPGTTPPRYVQMLGANLVIETTWKSDHKPVPDTEDPPWFIPQFPNVQDILGPKANASVVADLVKFQLTLTGLSDGGPVYPWFQGPKLQFLKFHPPEAVMQDIKEKSEHVTDLASLKMVLSNLQKSAQPNARDYLRATGDLQGLADGLTRLSISVCPVEKPGWPNRIPRPGPNDKCLPVKTIPTVEDGALEFNLLIQWKDPQMILTLEPGNYALRIDSPNATAKDKFGTHVFGVRFSVYTPFFQFPPGQTAKACPDPQHSNSYCDPERHGGRNRVVVAALDAVPESTRH